MGSTAEEKRTGPPPLPKAEDFWSSNGTAIVVLGALVLFTLLLLLFFMSTVTSSDVASSNSNGALSEKGVGEDGGNTSPGVNISPSAGLELSADNGQAVAISQNAQNQSQSSSERLKSNEQHPDDAVAISHRSENETASTDQEASPRPSIVDKTTTQDTRPLEKSQRTVSQFFTLDSPPSRKHAQPAQRLIPDDTVEQESELLGRMQGNKEELLKTQGGTATTEAAVKLGLEWLARNQNQYGLWGLQGPFRDGGTIDNPAAATAMALLAFQGAGHTHQGDPEDPFTDVVRNGWKGLLEYLKENRKRNQALGLHGGYTEALCTIAICELYGMTKDPRYRKPAVEALKYCLRAQSPQGGWRYLPGRDSDTSVTGWFLMALQSARMAKIKVPQSTLERVKQYLDAAESHRGERYAYQPGTIATHSMTAEGLLCRQYLGWQRNDPRLLAGTDFLLQQLPNWDTRNVYYWYYATQVTHHMGGEPWQRWNEVMRELLPAKQIQEGNERGSWEPQGHPHGSAGGRLYVTCMSLYMLEVYYRHLPIYQHGAVGE